MAKRTLNVAMNELIDAFDTGSYEIRYYLDLETGKVVPVTEEITLELGHFDVEPGDEDLAELVERSDLPEWEKIAVMEAALVEANVGDHFADIPWVESHDAYRDIEAFVESVDDSQLRQLLEIAIDRRGGPGSPGTSRAVPRRDSCSSR